MDKKHNLSPAEKLLIVKATEYFKKEKPNGAPGRSGSSAHVMAHWNHHHDPTFAVPEAPRGLRFHSPADSLSLEIRTLIRERNQAQKPITASIIRKNLDTLYGVEISIRTTHRVLHRLGYRFRRGVHRNYLAESQANVAYRARYLEAKLANRDINGNPILPEVYLDESYCNQHPRPLPAQWQGVVQTTVAGAFGSWVEGSLSFWQSQLKGTDNDYH
ncbi:hypothetical protein ACHHYP_12058, partial [Achlya hypogyna]